MFERIRIQFLSFVFGVMCAVPVISFADSAPAKDREVSVNNVQAPIEFRLPDAKAKRGTKVLTEKNQRKAVNRVGSKEVHTTARAAIPASGKRALKLSQQSAHAGKAPAKSA